MRSTFSGAAAMAALASTASAASLADVCTVANVQAAINTTLLGLDIDTSSVTAAAVNSSSTAYCNVTLAYAHTGKGDTVNLKYAFPAPEDFTNRYYTAGGGGYSLVSDATGGLTYGAVSGCTDAGYDAFSNSADAMVLYGNGSINWDVVRMFGYQALGELTIIGKSMTNGFYGLDSSEKVYTYFEGCSDGGREGMSQVQRFGVEYDGAITGAPAFRYAQQQVNHLFAVTVEHTLDYYPPSCELDAIVNATITACDGLDGRTDGVVSRTDLCALNFNVSSIIGQSYYCAAENSTSLGFGFAKRQQTTGSSSSSTPAQNGTVSAEGIAVIQTILDGLHNTTGARGYLPYQYAASFEDAATTYDSTTDSWTLSIPSTGGEFVTKFIELIDTDNLDSLDGVTYDTLIEWMDVALFRYQDTLQTTLPDLTPFVKSGGKLLHYHGESDNSIPTASSVHYWQSVRNIMYSDKTDDDAIAQLKEWYQLYLVPGAGHCGVNSLQPDGPFPEDNMATMIDWVENGVQPTQLNATVQGGQYEGETQMLCQWPLRPLWTDNSTGVQSECVYDQASYDSWTYEFPAFLYPIF